MGVFSYQRKKRFYVISTCILSIRMKEGEGTKDNRKSKGRDQKKSLIKAFLRYLFVRISTIFDISIGRVMLVYLLSKKTMDSQETLGSDLVNLDRKADKIRIFSCYSILSLPLLSNSSIFHQNHPQPWP